MMDDLIAALDATGYSFAHWGWARDAKEREHDHGVYAEDGVRFLWAGNHTAEGLLQCSVDYYTRDASATPREAIEAALNSLNGVSWYLNSVQLETDTGFIHWEWIVEGC